MSATLEMIDITVNGEARAVPVGTLAGLLMYLGLDTRKIAIERNREIVPRSLYGTVTVVAGDTLEIVHFIGGG